MEVSHIPYLFSRLSVLMEEFLNRFSTGEYIPLSRLAGFLIT